MRDLFTNLAVSKRKSELGVNSLLGVNKKKKGIRKYLIWKFLNCFTLIIYLSELYRIRNFQKWYALRLISNTSYRKRLVWQLISDTNILDDLFMEEGLKVAIITLM